MEAVGVFNPTSSPRFGFRGSGFVVGAGNLVVTNAHVLPDVIPTGGTEGSLAIIVPIPGGSVELLTGVDPAELAAKVAAERARLEQEIARVDGKLSNEKFVAGAPEAVVAAERAKRERYVAELAALGAG